MPIRTFSDWSNPLSGYLEVDFAEHCGGTEIDGDVVHSFVMTDIATAWTECFAMPYLSGTLVLEYVEGVSRLLKYTRAKAASLQLRGSRRKIFALCEFNVLLSDLRSIHGLIS
ncbi:hypothetical protein ACFQ3P_43285, partial [Paraburkholderia sabiae]